MLRSCPEVRLTIRFSVARPISVGRRHVMPSPPFALQTKGCACPCRKKSAPLSLAWEARNHERQRVFCKFLIRRLSRLECCKGVALVHAPIYSVSKTRGQLIAPEKEKTDLHIYESIRHESATIHSRAANTYTFLSNSMHLSDLFWN
jgi:hypothetical protein